METKQNNHVTVGVYPNDSCYINVVRPQHLHSHVNYNVEYRTGRALFIDGKCVIKSHLSDEKVKEWEERISLMDIDSSTPSDFYY